MGDGVFIEWRAGHDPRNPRGWIGAETDDEKPAEENPAVKLKIDIRANAPVFMEADADTFGLIFASMSSVEQVAVLDAIAEHMRPHPTQWDYIAFELEKPEHAKIHAELAALFFPEGNPS
jgi:hypothetical protein